MHTTLPTAGSTADGLYVNGGTVNITGNLDMSSSDQVASSASARIDSGSLTIGGTDTIGLDNSGRWSVLDVNGGTLTLTNTSTGISVGGPYAGNAEFLVRNGSATVGRIGLGYGTVADASVLNLTGGSLYVGAGGIVLVSANDTPTNILAGGILGAATNWSSAMPMILSGATIQAADASGNPQNIALNGPLSGAGGLTKTGSGILFLGGMVTNTYAGPTTVSGGLLLITNPVRSATSTNTVTVAGGGALGGYGIIAGAVTVNSGGMLVQGNGTAILTISNNLTLAAGSSTYMQVEHSPLTNTAVNVTGTLAEGGTLVVTNIGASALTNGDSFKLFKAGTYSGAFSGFVLPSLPAGLGWNTNNLAASGVLSVVLTAKPVFASAAISGNKFAFTGTGGLASANFYLLGTTNLAALRTNWTRLLTNQFDNNGKFNFTNSTGTNAQNFYLLQFP